MLICDTSGLLARYDPDEERHERAVAVMAAAAGPFVVSPLVLAEFDHLVRARHPRAAATTVIADVIGRGYRHPHLDSELLEACLSVDRQYVDLGLGLTDASLVVLAQTYDTTDLLTLDRRHFAAVRPLQGGWFDLPLLED
ncbi:MAG: type II toxin-antitoxin system VapC family toxin [Sporichthyaceae bacterium]